MKAKVDTERCIGCGACVAIAPENFDFNDEGLSILKNEEANEDAVSASEACPVSAIEIIEAEEANEDTVSASEDGPVSDIEIIEAEETEEEIAA